jgi:hypothetical protein
MCIDGVWKKYIEEFLNLHQTKKLALHFVAKSSKFKVPLVVQGHKCISSRPLVNNWCVGWYRFSGFGWCLQGENGDLWSTKP